MYVDIEKVIENLDIQDKKAYIGSFSNNIFFGKKTIEDLLEKIEKEDLNVWEVSDEIDELNDKLSAEITKMLLERNIVVESTIVGDYDKEEYVNKYPAFFEWQVIDRLEGPFLKAYYNKEDIAWMRKLLDTPFDTPVEERLQIYSDWKAYWDMRENSKKEHYIPSFEFYKPGFKGSKEMHIDMEKVIANLSLDEEYGSLGTFWSDLSIGKEVIKNLLNEIEPENISLIEVMDKIWEPESTLINEILKMLKEREIFLKRLGIFSEDEEEYVNQYPTFFEWLVINILDIPPVTGDYYLKEDIAWMHKLLDTPFDAPAEERLRIYRDWKAYWEMRSNMAEHDALPAVE